MKLYIFKSCVYSIHSNYCKWPGINVIVWSVRHQMAFIYAPIESRWSHILLHMIQVFMSLSLLTIKAFNENSTAWKKKKGLFLEYSSRWHPWKTTPDSECKRCCASVRAQDLHQSKRNTTTDCFMWEKQECFECWRVNLFSGYTTAVAFLRRYTANQVKKKEKIERRTNKKSIMENYRSLVGLKITSPCQKLPCGSMGLQFQPY